jgi:20S proteasome alpha/beta subunit
MQILTQYGGLRPYGVTIIFGGEDHVGTHLIEADPSGMLFEWYAYAIGRGAQTAMKILREEWKPSITKKDAVRLAVDILEKTEKIREGKKIDIAIVEDRKFKILKEEEIKKILK